MRVWVVTDAVYDEDRVVAVFSTEEKADAFIAARHRLYGLSSSWIDVDEIVDPPGMKSYRVCLLLDGDVLEIEPDCKGYVIEHIVPARELWRGHEEPEHFYWEGWAKDEEHAVNVARERMLVCLAAREGASE